MEESNVIMDETRWSSRPVQAHQNVDIPKIKKYVEVINDQLCSYDARFDEISNNIKNILFKLEQFEVEPISEADPEPISEADPEPISEAES